MKIKTGKEACLLIPVMLIGIVLIALCIKDGHDWGGDFSLYIAQAKSIGNNSIMELYRQNKFTIQHSTSELGPYLYPFGFPLLLSPVYFVAGIHFILMKGFCSLFLILSIPVMYKLFNEYFTHKFFVFCILICIAFHSDFVTFSDNILSDLPFFFFCFLSFMLMNKRKTVIIQILLGLCIYYSYFIKDMGLFLIPSLLIYQWQKAEYKNTGFAGKLILLIPYMLFFILFLVTNKFLPFGEENNFVKIRSRIFNWYFGLRYLVQWKINFNLSF